MENKIKLYLEKKEMLATELADLTGTTRQHISNIISGKKKHISLEMAMKIAKALEEKVETIFYIQ